ncbi:MAG: hypothetical protein JWQ14_2394, partial [Adhaeribacter sp.]|nr:hypothetical protein [Adhaeribacter sp.]
MNEASIITTLPVTNSGNSSSNSTPAKPIIFSPVKIFKWLLVIIGLLLVAHALTLLMQAFNPEKARMNELLDMFLNFNHESNLPAFFSTIQLLLAGAVLFLVPAYRTRRFTGFSYLGLGYSLHHLYFSCSLIFSKVCAPFTLHDHEFIFYQDSFLLMLPSESDVLKAIILK